MLRTIQIGEQQIPMLAMASVDYYFQQIFHEDPLKIQTSKSLDEADMINFLFRMGFVMAKFAELRSRKAMVQLNQDAYLDWLDQFDRGEYMDALEAVRDVYDGQKQPSSTAKKNND